MVLAFKEQFIKPILAGIKIHSMREDKGNRWRRWPQRIQMATGVRTKKYNCFFERALFSTQKVDIKYNGKTLQEIIAPEIIIDGRAISDSEKLLLAKNDGFETFAAFLAWFDKDFSGKIIHWTEFRY